MGAVSTSASLCIRVYGLAIFKWGVMSEADFPAFDGMSVTPEPGWVLHTPYGTARCGDGPDDYLVRLADVVRWFQNKRGLPLAVAVGRVVEGITVDSFQQMFFLDEHGWARPMWEPSPWDKYSMTPEEKALPYLEGRVLHCIQGLRNAWLMPAWQAEKFFNAGRPAGEPPAYDKERENVFEFLDRLGGSDAISAVRMRIAHELWGWGRTVAAVPAAVALQDMAAATPPASAIEAQDVTDWPSLVRYRLQFASLAAQKRQEWLPGHVEILAARLHEEHQARGRGALDRLAGELGLARSTVGELLKKRGFDQATGEKQQVTATAWSGMGARGDKSA